MPPVNIFTINVEIDVLTPGSTAEIVNAILELLVYRRNQIPFVYKTYKYLVAQWEERETGRDTEDRPISPLHSYQVERQRDLAKQTKEAISSMRRLITNSFESNTIKCLRFLFGSTAFTPKESYTIHIPVDSVTRSHRHEHHRFSDNIMNQMLLSLLTCEELYSTFSSNLRPTNLYLELEMLKMQDVDIQYDTECKIFPKEIGLLPASCRNIHIHLAHVRPENLDHNTLQCCSELIVYKDFLHLSLKTESNDSITIKEEDALRENDLPTWWEADVVVRGFKEKPIRGINMWAKE